MSTPSFDLKLQGCSRALMKFIRVWKQLVIDNWQLTKGLNDAFCKLQIANCKFLFLIYITFFTLSASAQAPNKHFGIVPEFVKNNTSQKVNEVASNVLRVTNYTNQAISFHIRFSIPPGWTMLAANNKTYELPAGDSAFIPVRVIIDKEAKGNTNYVLTASLISDKDVAFASQNWYTGIESRPEWSAAILLKKLYFINGCDSSGFSVHFQNSGNADETIHLNFRPDHRIEVVGSVKTEDGSGKAASNSSVTPLPASGIVFQLPVGIDTVLNFAVRRRMDFSNHSHKKDLEERFASGNEEYRVQASARSEESMGRPGQTWTGTVEFFKIGNELTKNEFKSSALPMTLEMNVYDILSNSTTMSLDAYGTSNFSNDRMLTYRFQTIFITNFLNERTFLGDNHYIGYFTHRYTLEVGEINGWGHSMIYGKGVKASFTAGRNKFGALATESPKLFSAAGVNSFGLYHSYQEKNFVISNYYSHINNNVLGLTNDLYSSTATVKINSSNQVSFGGGFSNEKYITPTTPLTVNGYGYEINYSYGYKKLNIGLGDQYGSSNYTLARGVSLVSGRATYYLSPEHNFSLTTQNFTQKADYYFNGVFYPGRFIRSDRYEARIGFLSQASVFYLKPLYTEDDNYSLHVITSGVGMEYNARNLNSMHLSANMYMGYANAVGYNLPDFFISRVAVNARWSRLNLNLHYFYGANQTTEQLRFIKDQINPQSVTFYSSYDYWFGHGSWLLTTNSAFLYQTYFGKTTFRLKPEIFYYTKSGFRLSMYMTYFSSKQEYNPAFTSANLENGTYQPVTSTELNMGFGIKKQIGIPIPGKKYKSVKVVVFKDFNGNRVQDKNEEGVENILVNIRLIKPSDADPDSSLTANQHGEDFVTNDKGEIVYNNIPAGIYRIKVMPLVHLGEWFDGKEEEIMIDGKQKVINMPLSKGVKVSGSILIERDKYSADKQDIDLSRIRITAIDSSGKAYSSLTDRSGSFSMYLPDAMYTLTMNESALSSNYECLQNKLVIDLTKPINENYSITFNVAERKREMKVKKFNSNGEIVK